MSPAQAQPVVAAAVAQPSPVPAQRSDPRESAGADQAEARRRSARRSKQVTAVVNVLGFVFASLLGLAIGYYVLCFVNPQGNFLNLPQSWFPWTIEQPVATDGNHP